MTMYMDTVLESHIDLLTCLDNLASMWKGRGYAAALCESLIWAKSVCV